jgi:hypothetical protein
VRKYFIRSLKKNWINKISPCPGRIFALCRTFSPLTPPE